MKLETEMDTDVIAMSPIVQASTELPHRIVLRDLKDQYVVHTMVMPIDDRPFFVHGNYFPKRFAGALLDAWGRFEDRSRRALGFPSIIRFTNSEDITAKGSDNALPP